MHNIDLMADFDLDNGDTKSDGFEFQTYSFLKATAEGAPSYVWVSDFSPSSSCDVPRQPHVSDVHSSFYSVLSLTCPLLFLLNIMEVNLNARLIMKCFDGQRFDA